MSGRELFQRHSGNPILTAEDWPYPANAVFNPAAAQIDGSTILLVRVEGLTGISHLTVARSPMDSTIGVSRPSRSLCPKRESKAKLGDSKTRAPCGSRNSTASSSPAPRTGLRDHAVYLATTRDFSSVDRHGIVFNPEDKNAAILPERVDGKWILFHRPTTGFGITHPGISHSPGISLSRSSDLASWSPPETVMEPRQGAWWDSLRIGIGPPLLKTEYGWLLIYHGVKETVAGALYRVGAALLDLDEPTRVIGRSSNWILGPREPYERTGDVPNAVFPCGLTHDRASGQLRLYYGAADTSICVATAVLDELLELVR